MDRSKTIVERGSLRLRRSCLLAVLGIILATAAQAQSDADLAALPPPGAKIAAAPKGFVPLFDGTSFSNWKYLKEYEEHWAVRDGGIYCDGQLKGVRGDARNLWTEKEYGNLVLIVDWRLPGEPQMHELPTFTPDGLYVRDAKGQIVKRAISFAGDSGIYLRGSGRYQVNIWSQPMGSGDINELHKDLKLSEEVRRACMPKKNADKPFGQWNRFVITLVGDRVSVLLNGQQVIDNALLPDVPPRGAIALQNHGDPVEFRNLFIRELP